MIATNYSINLPVPKGFRAVVAADVHSSPEYEKIIRMIGKCSPDMILIPGDLCDYPGDLKIPKQFLRLCANIAPVYYSFGNHERHADESLFDDISGVHMLNSKTAKFCGVTIGGLRSGFVGQREIAMMRTPKPDLSFLDYFESLPGVKLLLCHHPEYYSRYLNGRNIDLIISGHAHGGQWRVFGKGIFAPGQGFFPKYTSGIIDGRMIVSRGLANHSIIPRINNEPELAVVDVKPR